MASISTTVKPVDPVSRRLKGLMAEHGVTVYELSLAVGIPAETLSEKIDGKCEWLYQEILSITNFFGFSEIKMTFPELVNAVLARDY